MVVPTRTSPLPPMHITGFRGGRAVVTCQACCIDMEMDDIGGARSCCGRSVCRQCFTADCESCGLAFTGRSTLSAGVNGEVTRDIASFARSGIPTYEEYAHGDACVIEEAPWGRHCAACQVDLQPEGSSWRICRCGAVRCLACARWPCSECAVQDMASRDAAPNGDERAGQRDPSAVNGLEPSAEDEGLVNEHTNLEDPIELTPEQAARRRDQMASDHAEAQKRKRAHTREQAKRQTKEGLRPPRCRGAKRAVTFCSCNPTAASSFQDELEHGQTLGTADRIMVQEHGLGAEECEAAKTRLRKAGWDAVFDQAYIKHTNYGGGVAILAKSTAGIRPIRLAGGIADSEIDLLKGRFVCGITSDFGGIVCGSVYGISGLPIHLQYRLWRAIAIQLRIIGLPFVLAGDWQITPHEMRASGYHTLLGAEIIAPDTPTNIVTLRTIDYFVVSRPIAQHVQSITVAVGTRFSPHAPVVMTVQGQRSLGTVQRIVQPRILNVSRPIGPMAPGYRVAWEQWHQEDGVADGQPQAASPTGMEGLTDQWFAGAEAELLTTYGIARGDDEPHYSGIGKPVRMVEGTAGPSMRETPSATGLLGHRLAWAARALHLVNRWGHLFGRCDNTATACTQRQRRRAEDLIRAHGHRAIAFLKERRSASTDDDTVELEGVLTSALRLLAQLVRRSHRRQPLMDEWSKGRHERQKAHFGDMEAKVAWGH